MWLDILIGTLVAAVIAGAVIKIVYDRKKGAGCSGCPYSKDCQLKQNTNKGKNNRSGCA